MNFIKRLFGFLMLAAVICLLCIPASGQEADTITITSAEDLYALGRILAPEAAKTKYLSANNWDEDFSRFDVPEELTEKNRKIAYLCSCNYVLTADLSVSFSQGGNYFMGLGCSDYPFSGSFNGNGHTIELTAPDGVGINYYTGASLGLFNVTKNATIHALQLSVTDSIVVHSSYTNVYLGVLVGTSTTSVFQNCTVAINNAEFGMIPTDSNTKRSYVWIGGLIGYSNASTLKSCAVSLTDSAVIFKEQDDSLSTQAGVGGLIGRTVTDTTINEIIDCSFRGTRSQISNHTPMNGATAACIGNARKTHVTRFSVELYNSIIETTAVHAQEGSMYSVLSTGGIIGFSQPGSSNSANIGELGNVLNGCTLCAENMQLRSSAQTGSELTAGGLVGCSFNNLLIKDSSVSIERGRIYADKSGSTDTATYGVQVGGIIGRLEHTGEINSCSVTGRDLFIGARSPNNQSSAGGIVGIDLGPYHRNIISLNSCTFDGSGDSEICIEITSADAVGSKTVSVGGIAGTSTYIVANCTARNVTVSMIIPALSNPTYCSGLVGNYIKSWGWWAYKDYFTPYTPELRSCSSEGITWSGGCGSGVRWYVQDHMLRIAGQGSIDDFSNTAAPWNKYSGQLTTLILEDGITAVGTNAFSGCTKLKNLILGRGLQEIHTAAFSGCTPDHIAYAGTESEFSSMKLAENNGTVSAGNIAHWNLSNFPEITNPGIAPTCQSVGLTTGKNCGLCGQVLVAQQVLAAGDHVYDDCKCIWCGKELAVQVSIYENGNRVKSFPTIDAALEAYSCGQYLVLYADATCQLSLSSDIILDLNGHDLTGTITANGHSIYGMDSTTDRYSAADAGHFSCKDAQGTPITPVIHFKTTVTGAVMRYMAISDSQGYSFHRFYLAITHINLKPSVTGIGYKAVFYGDDRVKAQLDATEAFGYTLQLGENSPKTAYKDRNSYTSGHTLTLRIDNFHVESSSETPLYACALLKLSDGTVIASETVTTTFRSLLETVSANYTALTPQQLQAVQALIDKYPLIKQWDIADLYA